MMAKLQALAARFGTLHTDYSGRGMYGAECVGIVTEDPDALIEQAAAAGIFGARSDSMGLRWIVYWPAIRDDEFAIREGVAE